MNSNAAILPGRDMVGARLGPNAPATAKDRRDVSSHAISGIDVNTPNDKGSKRKRSNAPAPAVPADVIRKVRIGSTIALLLAAGISARTLFQLGQIIGLPKTFAWMLPGAFDVYAYTSATVAASIPAAHPARGWAVWNARVALSFTMIGNSLVHALYLMSHGQRWTGTDYALVAVSAIPPIIVERLLHLQTKIATEGSATVAAPATPNPATSPARPVATVDRVAAVANPTAPSQPRATRPAAALVAQADGNSTVATLVPKEEQLRIVRELVAEHGPDIPLAKITERIGGHKSTASRLRTTVNEENGTVPLDVAPAAGEVR